MNSYAVITSHVEADFELEPDGTLGICLWHEDGDQISVDLTPAEAGALRDWLNQRTRPESEKRMGDAT